MSFENNIARSEISYKKIYNFMVKLDEFYKEKYNDIDITNYFKVLKNKKKKTKYAYAIKSFDNNEIGPLLNTFFSLKYTNPEYDIICFIHDSNYYEKDYLDNIYLKYEALTDENIKIIKHLFDSVISTNISKFENTDNSNNSNIYYDFFYIPGYTDYEKILLIEHSCIVNENIDFLFGKYDKSTYSMTNSHRTYSGGLLPSITLINTNKYYIKKAQYLCDNYFIIFNKLYFFIPKHSNILYYTIFPKWTEEPFDENIVNFMWVYYPNIDIKYIDKYKYYVEYYSTIMQAPYFFKLEESKFQLNKKQYIKWDENVKKILKQYPEYEIFFSYIRTYRNTLF